MTNNWIPVIEKVPKTEDPVIGSFLDEDGTTWINFARYDILKHIWYETIAGRELDKTQQVTAWMPMPEPYKK